MVQPKREAKPTTRRSRLCLVTAIFCFLAAVVALSKCTERSYQQTLVEMFSPPSSSFPDSSSKETTTVHQCAVSDIPLPPIALRKGNRRGMSPPQYKNSASELVVSIQTLLAMAKANNFTHSQQLNGLDNLTIMDYGCGPGRFLVGLQHLGVCYHQYVGVDVGKQEIEWLNSTYKDNNTTDFILVNVQNDRYNRKGELLLAGDEEQANTSKGTTKSIFAPSDTAKWTGKIDLMVLRSVFSHMRIDDIYYHLRSLRPMLRPNSGVMAVSLFVRPKTLSDTVISQEKKDQKLHIVLIDKAEFEQKVYEAGYHVLLYTTLMGQETYFLSPGQQKDPSYAP